MKIGIVFSGQGAQYKGMGEDLYNGFSMAKKVFDEAGEEIKNWCFTADKETLRQTHITQPTIYTMSMAAYEAFMGEIEASKLKEDLDIVAVAGFSLGEYAALTAAGSIDSINKGINIVTQRGLLMHEAGLDSEGNSKGMMAAGIGDKDKILAIVEETKNNEILEAVNFNSPKQTVVAGDKTAVKRFVAKAKEARIKAIPLSVGTAFHSQMMAPAAEKLKDVLRKEKLMKPALALYTDATADNIMNDYKVEMDVGEYLVEMMAKQAKSPVYWEKIIRRFESDGVEAIIEIGPGKTLTGFTQKTTHEVEALHVEDCTSLETTINRLKEMVEEGR